MNKYIQKLFHELSQYEAICGCKSNTSILDTLWYCYASANPIDDGYIKKAETAMAPVFRELSFESNNTLFDLITELVTAYQRAAFLEGILLGAELAKELA